MNPLRLHQEPTPIPATLIWEEPPTRNAPGKYAEITSALRANPNRWAVLTTIPAAEKRRGWALSNVINTARLRDFQPERGRFEATCRTQNGETRVYVRFLEAAKVVSL